VDEPFCAVVDQIITGPAERRGPSRIDVEGPPAQVGHNEKVLGKLPDAVALLGLCLDAFGQCFAECPQTLLAGNEVGFNPLAFGDFLGGNIDTDDVSAPAFQWMPISNPDPLHVRSVRPLAVDLDTGDRIARTQDCLHNMFNLIGDLRNRLTDRSSKVFSDRNAADFGHMLIYQYVATISTEKGKADRCGLVNQLQLGGSSQSFD
jgi:hypothetical protein